MTKRERMRIEKAAQRLARAVNAAGLPDRPFGLCSEVTAEGEATMYQVISIAVTPRKWLAVHLCEQSTALLRASVKSEAK